MAQHAATHSPHLVETDAIEKRRILANAGICLGRRCATCERLGMPLRVPAVPWRLSCAYDISSENRSASGSWSSDEAVGMLRSTLCQVNTSYFADRRTGSAEQSN